MSYGDPGWRDWILPESAARPFFERALELGINFFDTADMYSLGVSEEVTGRLLRELAPRDDVVVATKVFFPMAEGPNRGGLSRKHILAAIDASLRRLGMDHVDLYQIHRFDPSTPLDETLEALHEVVRAGKARYVGASSMASWRFAKSLYLADLRGFTRFVSMQNHYNLVYREEEREMLPLCREEGIGVIPWSPLARGFLTGTRTRDKAPATKREATDDYALKMYYADSDWQVVERVVEIAEERGVAPAQVALAWLLAQPGVVAPIIGATQLEHLESAAAAVSLELSEDERRRLEEPYQPHPVLGHTS
jgi:aryl-alcohol dehydrogenase (NADP+)